VHALVGADHLTGSALGGSASQDSFAVALGGGVQWDLGGRWAVRGSGDYVLTRHNIFGSQLNNYTQNNFRASVGVVYYIGGVREKPTAQRQPRHVTASCSNPTEISSLGISGCWLESGYSVSSVRTGSLAAASGISSGDVLVSINGRVVRSDGEVDQAIAADKTGTLKVGYLLKGSWLTEREITTR
jgi:hypothetical protein